MSEKESSTDEKKKPSTSKEEGKSSSKTCLCGFDRYHYMVSIVPTYTRWGAFWVTMMGVSSTPIRIDFVCRVCKTTFDRERNIDELKKFL
ncbi:MAG: hypothetical protein CMK59_05600 [Proteobacteria bacterium]|nr:hypothetical protein [Pseudomonadota bacterium]